MSLSLIFVVALIVFFLLTYRRSAVEGPAFPQLDQVATVQLKGFAILLVIVSHLTNTGFLKLPYSFKFMGAWGVAIFLLLSGYGLAQSYLRNGITAERFLRKRFCKVLAPYVLVTIAWLLVDWIMLSKTYSIRTTLFALIGMDFTTALDPTLWFVTYIILWYLVFFFVFKLPIPDYLKVSALFILAYIFKIYNEPDTASRVIWQWTLHIFVFPTGILLGLYLKRLSSQIKARTLSILFAVVAVFSVFVFSRYVYHSLEGFTYYRYANMSFAFIALSLTALSRYINLASRPSIFFGILSYEMYLFEWALLGKYPLINVTSIKWLALPVYFLAVVLLSILLRRATRFIIRCGGRGLTYIYSYDQFRQEFSLLPSRIRALLSYRSLS